MVNFEHAGSTIAFDSLPEKSRAALIMRGWNHYRGNEVASRVSSFFKRRLESDKVAIPESDSDEYVAKKNEFLADAVTALVAGTVGESRGPRVDPIEAEVNKSAKASVIAVLVGKKLWSGAKHPTLDQEWTFGTEIVSFGTLIDRYIAKFGESLTKAAKAKIEAERRRLEKVKADSEKAGTVASSADLF